MLLLIPEIRMPKVELEIIKGMTSKGYYLVYINATKPYSTMMKVFGNAKIDTEKVFFIDLVTRLVGMDIQRAGNCVFCSPQSLTDIGILVQTTVESIPKEYELIGENSRDVELAKEGDIKEDIDFPLKKK